ncbi:T9SS type A sorting domain-containing protein [Aurantibacillus circumpalustris]|uniref:T9SS type A sorting domain-containing protein n=1 Tax=Aurantibacillus circumpalustris TaxID=3036359 RepID=UPI00295B9579|nr:T9SS type A sorting domain-containing protein [Aurantibacillus circumpalustris]
MKKKYTNYGISLFLFFAFKAAAQISGIVTVNSGAPTGGTNYQTFNALRTALVTSGISGNLTVNVVANSGPYNEQVDFPAIVGVNAGSTITVNGNGCLLTFNSSNSGQPWTLGLNGADYMTFNSLYIEALGSTYALACHLWNAADNNAFNTCTITAPSSGSSSSQIPLSISGNATGPTTTGNCGNNNNFTSCVIEGGYYGVTIYALTASPFNTGNNIINCTIRDFFAYGIINAYHRNFILSGNTIERPNQSITTTCVGIYLSTQSYSVLVERNLIHKLFENAPGTTGTTYGMYLSTSVTGSINIIRNNIVSVTKTNGTIYGLYLPTGNYNNVLHNTVSIGDAYTSGTGAIRGIYSTGGTSTSINNNIVSITHPGTGAKYCLYYTIATTVSNYNDLYMNSGGTTNYIGYYTANQTTMLNWQAINSGAFDQASWSVNPLFASPPFGNFTPGSNALNNVGLNLGLGNDFYNASRGSTPDPGAIEFYNTACTGAPSTGAVIAPSGTLCPGSSVVLGIPSNYNSSGLSFQWQTSNQSAFGPFTTVATATNQYIVTPPINSQVWYSAVVTCVGGTSIALASGQLSVVPTTTSSVPYFEGFEGIASNNKLPNCNWAVSNLANCQTYTGPVNSNRVAHSGNKYAAFYYSPSGTSYFYSNGIQLFAGITYSASMWYIAGFSNYPDWANLSMSIGPNQSPTGLVPVATQAGNLTNSSYAALSNTFQVTNSGIYYAAIKVSTQSGYGYFPYFAWDDLSITIPCALNPVSVTVGSSTNVICAGEDVTIIASGANSYLWSGGQTSSSITVTPSSNSSYAVTGTSTLTGCSSQGPSQLITVNPTPIISIVANNAVSCPGQAIALQAVGNADTFAWSNSSTAQVIVVNPTASTSYSVLGTNVYGCIKQAIYNVTVNISPTITASYQSEICQGEMATLSASGAVSYVWTSNSSYLPVNPAIVSPNISTIYTVTGTDNNGCTAKAVAVIQVDPCVGIKQTNPLSNTIKVYPNPASTEFNIELGKGSIQNIEVTDIAGRIIMKVNSGQVKTTLDISSLSKGVYYVKIQTNENSIEAIKMIKQ